MNTLLRYGPLGLFFGLLLEYFGLPVPGETLLLLTGALEKETAALLLPFAASSLGCALGSWGAYRIGLAVRRETLLELLGRFGLRPAEWERSERLLVKTRKPLLLFGRYVPGVRHLVPYLVGLERMPEGEFLAYNAGSALAWCGPLLLLGRFFGAEWPLIVLRLHQSGLVLVAGLAALSLLWLWRSRRRPPGPA